MSKIFWVDTETTGLSQTKHGIISIAGIFDIDGIIVDTIDLEMKPTGRKSDNRALQINGYTHGRISKFKPWEQVFPEFITAINRISRKHFPDKKFTLAGQNIPFDNRHVRSWAEYCEALEYWDILIDQDNMIDTQKISKQFPELDSHKLGNLCKAFGVRLDNAHNAMADIAATRELYYAMLKRIEEEKQMELI